MIDVKKACELATKENKEPFVSSIIDIEHSFVISTLSADGLEADVMPLMVNKETGKTETCFFPDCFDEISRGKDVDIPAEYQFNN